MTLRKSYNRSKKLRDDFGFEINTAVQHDVNGLAWPMVGLLKDIGVDHLLMAINVHFGEAPFTRPCCFDWQGPCGQSLRTWNGLHYNAFNRETGRKDGEKDIHAMANKLGHFLETLETKEYPHDFVVMTATHPGFDDNNPPDFELPEIIRAWNEAGLSPQLSFISLQEISAKLNALENIPTHTGDWTDYWTFGVGSGALEVAAARAAREKIEAADRLQALTQTTDFKTRAIARNQLDLHLEHTWGSWASTGAFFAPKDIEPVPVYEQSRQKDTFAWISHSHATMYLRDTLENTTTNPRQGHGCEALMIYNPSCTERHAPLRVPNELLDGKWSHFSSTIHRLDVLRWFLTEENSTWLDLGTIPANSITTIPVAEVQQAATPKNISSSESHIESPHYRLEYNGQTGDIISLTDKSTGHELIDSTSPYDFFGPIQETVAQPSARALETGDIRETFMELDFDRWHAGEDCWNPDWSATRRGPHQLLKTSVTTDPSGVHLEREYDMPGFSVFKQTISLPAHQAAVKLSLYGVKTEDSAPESLYITFPVNIGKPTVTFQAAGHPVQYDAQQLPGSCRDHLATDSWIACHNDQQAVILASPDAPLFQVGGFTFAQHLEKALPHEKALLLNWPMNNYWNTNFKTSQPGPIRLRYRLTSPAEVNPAEATRNASFQPLHYHPVVSAPEQPTVTRIISVEGEGVSLLHVGKHPDHPDALICRLQNHTETPSPATVSLPDIKATSVQLASTLLEPTADLTLSAEGTFIVETAPATITTCIIKTQT